MSHTRTPTPISGVRVVSVICAWIVPALSAPANAQPPPLAADQPELVLQLGHSDWVQSVAFSPDGRRLASSSHDHTVRLWDVETGACLRTLVGHTGWVTAVTFSPDGRRLASGSGDVRLWDAETGACLKILKGQDSVAFSPDGRLLASGGRPGVLWDVETGASLRPLEGTSSRAESVAFSPDGRWVAAGCCDHTVRLCDSRTGACVRTFEGHAGHVACVAFSPDGRWLASSSFHIGRHTDGQPFEDYTVRLWDVETGACVRAIEGHHGNVRSVSLSPDGRLLASASTDCTVRLWDVETGACLWTLRHPVAANGVAFSPDGKCLASADLRFIRLWDAETGMCLRQMGDYKPYHGDAAYSRDGRWLATSGPFIWDAATGTYVRGPFEDGGDLAVFSPDGRWIASRIANKPAPLFDVETGACARTFDWVGWLWSLDFSPDGRWLALGSAEPTVGVWNVDTGACLRRLEGHVDQVPAVAFSPDGRYLASGGFDKTVRLWEAETGQCLRTLAEHTAALHAVVFSPDGRRLASGGDDGTIRLWSVETGECLRTVQAHESTVWTLSFSPDGRWLASGSDDGQVRIWDPDTGVRLYTLGAHTGVVWRVAFSPDGRRLVTASDCTRIWDTATRRELCRLISISGAGLGRGAWLAITPEGYYDGTTDAARLIRWRVGNELFPVEAYREIFHRPDLVRRALANGSLSGLETITTGMVPPLVKIVAPQPGAVLSTGEVTMTLTATAQVKITDWEVLANGRPLLGPAGRGIPLEARGIALEARELPQGHTLAWEVTGTVALPPGEESVSLKARVRDGNGLWSDFVSVSVAQKAGPPVREGLHVLAIGVSAYEKSAYALRYAAADAKAIAAALESQAGEGKLYATVAARTLTDAEATREAIRAALSTLQDAVGGADTAVVFIAGHGLRDESGRYLYLATHETDAEDLAATALPWEELELALERLRAKHVLVLLDTCHSGGATAKLCATNQALADSLWAQAGVIVLASSSAAQPSWESPYWEHGAFTQALLEALSGEAGKQLPPGTLADYVGGRTRELTSNRQSPQIRMSDYPAGRPLLLGG